MILILSHRQSAPLLAPIFYTFILQKAFFAQNTHKSRRERVNTIRSRIGKNPRHGNFTLWEKWTESGNITVSAQYTVENLKTAENMVELPTFCLLQEIAHAKLYGVKFYTGSRIRTVSAYQCAVNHWPKCPKKIVQLAHVHFLKETSSG